ncbi:MAG: alkaline phosphatase family protein [Candidatus Brocadiaceae bacterium]|jgi:predicted AlkP superfamily phosphohydrolase/phosphomutase
MFFGFGRSRRVVGIGLDGFPYSLAEELMDEGVMPNLHRLAERGSMKRIRSVFPTVSGVAWSAFQTGRNPGEFGVFGFVELQPDLQLTIPDHNALQCPTLWERLDDAGRKFAALSVPMTYPAPPVDGFLVSGFLTPGLELSENAVSRPDVLTRLKEMDYEIDIDPTVAIEDPERFKEDLTRVSEARQKTALALLEEEDDWDLFFLHVMDTDRINHFLWRGRGAASSGEDGFFWDFYRKLDDFLGKVVDLLEGDQDLLVCSDHGFCQLEWEVQLNRWLKNQGYLDYENDPQKAYQAVKPGSRAVSLVPGRIHILRESQWELGEVTDKEYEPLRKEIMDNLRAVRHPGTGQVICKQVMKREEIFEGAHLDRAPDILADPCDGYDLKAKLGVGHLFEKGPRTGMHTYENAMLLVGGNLKDIGKAEDIMEVGRLTAKHVL